MKFFAAVGLVAAALAAANCADASVAAVGAPPAAIAGAAKIDADPACNVYFHTPYTHQPNAYTCGATSLSMVMGYYGTNKTVSQICEWMGCPTNGVGEDRLIAAAKHFGFPSAVVKHGWAELEATIAQKKSVVAHIITKAHAYPAYCTGAPVYSEFSGGHYIEVHGISCTNAGEVSCVHVNDPAQPYLAYQQYSRSSFNSAWGETGFAFITLH